MQTAPLVRDLARPDDAEKQRVHKAFADGQPIRVPVALGTNPRHVVVKPEWNVWGYNFQQAYEDPEAHLRIELQHQLYRKRFISRFCDETSELPDKWVVGQELYNVYEAAALGCPMEYPPEQVPTTHPFETQAELEQAMRQDITRPLELPYWKWRVAFQSELEKVAAGMTFEGRPVEVTPLMCLGSDGPVTVACNLRGSEFLTDLLAEPEQADRLMRFVTDAALHRRRAFRELHPEHPGFAPWLADDSTQMISVNMYRERVLPLHRELYDDGDDHGRAEMERGMHLCGDATRHFPTIHEELGVTNFDTGFPVDHGKLRDELGDDVMISGGPSVDLLTDSHPDRVYERTREILQSGVMRGGRFLLREANNLPPNAREECLEAMYTAGLEYGWYSEPAKTS